MSEDIIEEMMNEPEINPVDLIVKNVKLNSENKHVKEENEKLQEQIAQTEQNALELVDTIYQIQKENREKQQEDKCEYNTNVSCIFHDSLVGQIKSCIELTTQLKHQVHDECLYVCICILLQKLEDILKKG